MDQSKTNLPHLIQCTKSTQNLWNLRTHLTGALLHTQSPKGKLAFGYYDLLQWPHDCNLTLNIFLQVLQELTAKFCTLPKILYMQLDNYYRENKNRYILGFCAPLVQLKIVRKVSCSYIQGVHNHFLVLPTFFPLFTISALLPC